MPLEKHASPACKDQTAGGWTWPQADADDHIVDESIRVGGIRGRGNPVSKNLVPRRATHHHSSIGGRNVAVAPTGETEMLKPESEKKDTELEAIRRAHRRAVETREKGGPALPSEEVRAAVREVAIAKNDYLRTMLMSRDPLAELSDHSKDNEIACRDKLVDAFDRAVRIVRPHFSTGGETLAFLHGLVEMKEAF